MKYLNKYVRFFEAEVAVKTKVATPETKPADPIPASSADAVVERLSAIYANLDAEGKSEIDSYFE